MITSHFRRSSLDGTKERSWLNTVRALVNPDIKGIDIEKRFLVDSTTTLDATAMHKLGRLLTVPFEPGMLTRSSSFSDDDQVIEVGTRLERVTPDSTNAVSICHACDINSVTRLEENRRMRIRMKPGSQLQEQQLQDIISLFHDRMTEQPYKEIPKMFDPGVVPMPVRVYDIIGTGPSELDNACKDMGLPIFRDEIKQYFCNHFIALAGRNPTDVEIFMFAQLNSNHCRHFVFQAIYVIDGEIMDSSPFDMIKSTYKANPGNVVLAFTDNAGATAAVPIKIMMPIDPSMPSKYAMREIRACAIFKIETHNHPTGVSPYEGAATGVAVVRDAFGTGRGGIPVYQFSGYFVGSLFIPEYDLIWEEKHADHPDNLATPLKIAIRASDGASDNCNKKGLPIILGTFRTCDIMVGDDHYAYTKPVMVAGVGGYMDESHLEKMEIEAGDLIVLIGGDAFATGVGGGSGSSTGAGVQSAASEFSSVQRDDAEKERANYNAIRACSEMGAKNIIKEMTDLGAGGISVAGPEIVHDKARKTGARVELREIPCGDSTMMVYVYVGNEAQERMVLIIAEKDLEVFMRICRRYRCKAAVIGTVSDDGRFVITDRDAGSDAPREQQVPVDLDMSFLLSDLPQITISDKRVKRKLKPFVLSSDIKTIRDALWWVLRYPDVASKMWLIQKGDRSVGGKIAQQQAVGPLQLPLADCAVVANGFYQNDGDAVSMGEQPIVGLVNTEAGGRMSVGEALTNLVWALVKDLSSVSLSATWQWPCGQEGEDARLYDTVKAVTELLCENIGIPIPIFVGKDSTSMYAKTKKNGRSHTIKAPGTVEISAIAPCPDITKVITPDIKRPGKSKLMLIDISKGKMRLGGSILARVCGQIGDEAPDIDEPQLLVKGFKAIQHMIRRGLILSGHDRSDGGLITCLLEMAFAGNCGLGVNLPQSVWGKDPFKALFNQELGLVFEYMPKDENKIRGILNRHGLGSCSHVLGNTRNSEDISIRHAGNDVITENVRELRDWWFETSAKLSAQQSNPKCAEEERQTLYASNGLKMSLSFTPKPTPQRILRAKTKPAAAVIVEEGTNGEDELINALICSGFDVKKVAITDLIDGLITLDEFRLLAIPGGFSYSDTLGAGVGLASEILMNPVLSEQFSRFKARSDTLSWCPCNGFQVSNQIGWVPLPEVELHKQPRLVENTSQMFESRFVAVRVMPSPSIFLKGMEDSVLGIWVAHREGRCYWPDDEIYRKACKQNLIPLRFVDENSNPTMVYPCNPNGSVGGITGLCSADGRHLGLMPHAERLFEKWQWPWMPKEWKSLKASPWLRMFQNARVWCEQNP